MMDSTQADYVAFKQAFVSASTLSAKMSSARKLIEFTHAVLDMFHIDATDLAELTLEHMNDLSEIERRMIAKEIKTLADRTIKEKVINKSLGLDPVLRWQGEFPDEETALIQQPQVPFVVLNFQDRTGPILI